MPTVPSSENYFASARAALEQGDLGLALNQVAAALSVDPKNANCLWWLSEQFQNTPELVSHIDRHDPFFGLVAVRAWLLSLSGERCEAIELLLRVVEFRPAIPYLTWLGSWLEAAPLRGCNVNKLGPPLSRFIQTAPEPICDPGQTENAEGAVLLLETLIAQHPDHRKLPLLLITLVRKLGRREEAVRLAQRHEKSHSSWDAAVTVGNTLRACGRLDEALDAYERALEKRPDDPSTLLDIGDLCLRTRALERAAHAYGRILSVQPDHAWAKAGLAATEFLSNPSDPVKDAAVRTWECDPEMGPHVKRWLGTPANQ